MSNTQQEHTPQPLLQGSLESAPPLRQIIEVIYKNPDDEDATDCFILVEGAGEPSDNEDNKIIIATLHGRIMRTRLHSLTGIPVYDFVIRDMFGGLHLGWAQTYEWWNPWSFREIVHHVTNGKAFILPGYEEAVALAIAELSEEDVPMPQSKQQQTFAPEQVSKLPKETTKAENVKITLEATPPSETLPQMLRRIRKEMPGKISSAELSQKIGKSRGYYGNLERGLIAPGNAALDAIAKVTGASKRELSKATRAFRLANHLASLSTRNELPETA